MNDNLPDHLHATRDLLLSSVRGQTDETPPPPPPGLLDDLEARLGGKRSTQAAHPVETSLLDKLRSFFATPAFGVVAALILLLFIAIPLMKGPESFRGGAGTGGATVNLVLIGSDDTTTDFLKTDGLIDADAFTIVADHEAAAQIDSPKILIDFTAQTISLFTADGTLSETRPLPVDPAALPTAIATALSTLSGE